MELGFFSMSDLSEWATGALRNWGRNQSDLAKALTDKLQRPYGQTTISKIINGDRELKFDEVVAISLITSSPLPLQSIGNRVIPVTGGIRDGGIIVDYKSPVDFVEVPPDGATNVLAYEVLGTNAATGVAYDKWIVYVEEEIGPASPVDIGKAVLVKMTDQPVTLKMVEAGTRPDKYNIRSTLTGQVWQDAPIEWVRRVTWIKPR